MNTSFFGWLRNRLAISARTLGWAGSFWRVGVSLALLLGVLGWGGQALWVRAAGNATFVVNSTADEVDANPGDGVCETAAGNGVCTLRAAIQETNALAGADTITLPAGTYTLTLVGVDFNAAVGDLDILDDLTINGAGSATTTIDANGAVTNDRAFNIPYTWLNVTINGVTVTNGSIARNGGAIINSGALVISNSVFHNNDVIRSDTENADGGAIYTTGNLTVSQSTFSSNQALSSTRSANGGAVFVKTNATANFNDVTFTNNSVSGAANYSGAGGALYNQGKTSIVLSDLNQNEATSLSPTLYYTALGGAIVNTASGELTIEGTNLFNNDAGYGGAIYASGSTNLTAAIIAYNDAYHGAGVYVNDATPFVLALSVVSGNEADQLGGGIFSKGILTLDNTTVSENLAVTAGGGVANYGVFTAFMSNIADNLADDPVNFGESGGGIFNASSQPATLVHSVIQNNQAEFGGGIYHTGVYTMTIQTSTLKGNSATSSGGGIYSLNPLVIQQSTLTGNTTGSDGGGLNMQGLAHISNSTFSANAANRNAGAIYVGFSSQLYLSNVTITLNKADQDFATTPSGDGGGIFNAGTVTLRNTVIAGNDDMSPSANQPEDCYGALVSGGYNLLGNNANCTGLINGVNGDKVGTNAAPLNPLLGALASNGGATQTHLPQAGSPLVDAGNPAGCYDYRNLPLFLDQRGNFRPVDGDTNGSTICDIGAVERLAVIAKFVFLPLVIR